MNISKLLCAVAVAVSAGFAQTYNISGIVTDTGTTPIAGAVVKLENAGLTAISGADGRFTLSEKIVIAGKSGGVAVQRPAVRLQDGFIRLDLKEQSIVRVQVYSVQGRLLSTVERTVGAGTQSFCVPQAGTGVCIYRVKIGEKETFDVKRVTLDGKQGTLRQSSAEDRGTERQAKTAAAINDVIAATKTGYLNYRCVQFTSDTAGLAIKMIASAGDMTDADGNVYQTVKIGNQVWMAENYRVTKYNDGSAIPLDTSTATWPITRTPKYCYYNNTTNTDSIKKYGALYNWYVVNPANFKMIAPAGWHVPTDAEWDTLQNFLIPQGYNWDNTTTGNKIAKSLAAQTDWQTFTTAGTIGRDLTKNNRSGFSLLGGGYRYNHGVFHGQSYYGRWWSATESKDASIAWYRSLCREWDYLGKYSNYGKSCGFSVRLVRD